MKRRFLPGLQEEKGTACRLIDQFSGGTLIAILDDLKKGGAEAKSAPPLDCLYIKGH